MGSSMEVTRWREDMGQGQCQAEGTEQGFLPRLKCAPCPTYKTLGKLAGSRDCLREDIESQSWSFYSGDLGKLQWGSAGRGPVPKPWTWPSPKVWWEP